MKEATTTIIGPEITSQTCPYDHQGWLVDFEALEFDMQKPF
jgi:hypothetical protein